jgi:T4 RnlA family RNA ligase
VNLYNNLMALTEQSEGFFFKDFQHTDGATYRIFNYRLVGWEEFHTLDDALECRGIMYRETDSNGWELVCRPPTKFFNVHEGAVDHDWSNPMSIMTKEDGSLISSFIDANGKLGLKSKGSLSSSQALEAYNTANDGAGTTGEMWYVTKNGYTINCEYVSPTNRIVLSYEKPALVILNFRHTQSGEYITLDELEQKLCYSLPHIREMMVVDHYINGMDVDEFVASVPDMTGIEGYVILKNNGEHTKLKTAEYIVLHHSKDSVNNPKALYDVVLEDATDDLRTLFTDDQIVLGLISKMEKAVDPLYNHLVSRVEFFHSNYKDLDRKGYAVTGQKELEPYEFSQAMNLYLGKSTDYKGVMAKRWQSLAPRIVKEVYGVEYEY